MLEKTIKPQSENEKVTDKDVTPIEEIIILEEREAVAIGTVGTPK